MMTAIRRLFDKWRVHRERMLDARVAARENLRSYKRFTGDEGGPPPFTGL